MTKTITGEVLDSWFMHFAHRALIKITEDLSEEQFARRRSAEAPPVGWHLFHVARLADRLQANFRSEMSDRNYSPNLPGQIWAEEDLADTLRQPDRCVHVLEDLVDLKRLLDSAGGYIGNDSGASHLAAYSGLPSAVIFGPADPVRWAPVGRSVIIVKSDLQCRPCFEIDEIDCGGSQCLEGIPPQKVIEAFYKVYPDHLKIK